MKNIVKYLHEDATVRDYPSDSKTVQVEFLVPESSAERALMFSLICLSMNLSIDGTDQFPVSEHGIWDAGEVGNLVVYRQCCASRNSTDGTVIVLLLKSVEVGGVECFSINDPPWFSDDQDDDEEELTERECEQADADFRSWPTLQRKLFMDSCLRTQSAEFGMDRHAYKAWESQIVEICRKNKTSLVDIVADLGISGWYRRFLEMQPPESVWKDVVTARSVRRA